MKKGLTRLTIYVLLIFISVITNITGQSNCSDPIAVCDVAELDGLGTQNVIELPPVGVDTVQPMSLCNGDGVADNPVWYSFIAGATTISLSIRPKNCTEVPDGQGGLVSGIQAAIFDNCDLEDDGDFGMVMDCDASGVSTGTIELTSSDFICGKTYYLLLDGYSGSICEYQISVIEGDDLFELPDLENISYDPGSCDPHPLCEGAEILFHSGGFVAGSGSCPGDIGSDVEIFYKWSISPVTTLYPTGMHPSISDSALFIFEEAGIYTISCYAYTLTADGSGTICHQTGIATIEPTTIEIVDNSSINEVFPEISVCQGDFPYFIPDVNWLGGPIMTPGITEFDVITPCGCIYTQSINAVQIDLSPRVDIDTFICTAIPGPYFFNGVEITEDVVSNMSLTATNGCDSLISLRAIFLELEGNLTLEGCTDSVEIIFNIDHHKPDTIDLVDFRWELNSIEITDNNNDDSSLKVVDPGEYHLYVSMDIEGDNCEFYIGSVVVDFSNITTDIPLPLDWPTGVCPGPASSSVPFEIGNSSPGIIYEWTLPSDVILLSGQGSELVSTDWSSSVGGEICVKANSICGTSEDTCMTINIEEIPLVSLSMSDSICIDEVAFLEYTGDTNHSYSPVWDFESAAVTNTGGTDMGPYELEYISDGVKYVSLYLTNGVCESAIVNDTVNVVNKIAAPSLTCESSGNDVTISWNVDPAVDVYSVILLSGLSGTLTDNTYTSTGGIANDSVEIVVYGITSDLCNQTYADTIKCYFDTCPTYVLTLGAENDEFCQGDNNPYLLSADIIPSPATNGVWSGTGLINQTHFSPDLMNIGDNYLTYSYIEDNCEYKDSILIEVLANPEFKIDITNPDCENSIGQINITPLSSFSLKFSVNGSDFTSQLNYDIVGPYEIICMDENLCESSMLGVIDPFIEPTIDIYGKSTIRLGDEAELEVSTDIIDHRIDSIIWSKNGVPFCPDCTLISNLQEEVEVEYCVDIYFDGVCHVQTCKTVYAAEFVGVYFPNIIMPESENSDINYFNIDIGRREGVLKSLIIYDHWGGQMFKTENLHIIGEEILWDGFYRGEVVQPGVYVYHYELELSDGKNITKVGDLTVIR